MDKPILFSSDMVRAILDGRKTQTRRVIKPQPKPNPKQSEALMFKDCLMWEPWSMGHCNPGYKHVARHCPYGQPGDHLWVRESWRIIGWHDGEPLRLEYRDGTQMDEPRDSSYYDEDKYIQFYIDCSDDCANAGVPLDKDENLYLTDEFGSIPTRWRPSIFMPKFASRITLEVLDIRVERVQDISNREVGSEGLQICIRAKFSQLWDSINANRKDKDGNPLPYSWNDNPWVWVREFKKLGE